MNRKILALTALILTAIAFTAGALTTIALNHPQTHTITVVHTQDQVQSFNDGWNTALYGDATPSPAASAK